MNQTLKPRRKTSSDRKAGNHLAGGKIGLQTEEHRQLLVNYRRLLFTLVGFALVTVIFYGVVYVQSKVWQALLAPGIILASLVVAPLVYFMAARGLTILPGLILMVGMAIAYGANEISWVGLLPFHLVGGLLMIFVGGSFILPRRKWLWVMGAAIYILFLAYVNVFPPIQRVPQEQVPLLLPYAVGSNFLLIVALVFQFFLQFPSGRLRTRLLWAFVLLGFIPVTVVGTLINIVAVQTEQNQARSQLNTVVAMKVEDIQNWTDNVQASLQTLATAPGDVKNIEALLTKMDPSDTLTYQSLYAETQARYLQLIATTGYFDEIYLLDTGKVVVLSTLDENVGLVRAELTDFDKGLGSPYLTPPYLSAATGLPLMVVEIPIQNDARQTLAVLAGEVNLSYLNGLMSSKTGLGQSGETYLINQDRRFLTPTLSKTYQAGDKAPDTLASGPTTGGGIYDNYEGVLVTGAYQWIDALQSAVVAEQRQTEVIRPAMNSLWSTVGLALISVLIAIGIGLIATRNIVTPLSDLARVTEQIALGNLDLTADTSSIDEISSMAASINSMTGQLRGMVTGLEARIMERTRALEKRSVQLQVAAEVARDATSIRNIDELLARAVELIRTRFGYYHVGIFLLDERGDFAVLKAATGEAGRQMIEKGHRLKVGEVGMVGYVAMAGVLRVAEEVTQDQVYYLNPYLPDTRAEAALPLKSGARLFGVVDIQSTVPNAFDQDAVYVLQIIADQLAVSIQSALLFQETNQALHELEHAYGVFTQESWKGLQRSASLAEKEVNLPMIEVEPLGYRYRNFGIEPIYRHDVEKEAKTRPRIEAASVTSLTQDGSTMLAVPIKVRGQEIGSIEVQFEQPEQAREAAPIFEDISNRLALLLENTRLLQEAQRLASREQRINLISAQVRSTIDLDAILRNTVREFGKAFGAKQTFVQLGTVESTTAEPAPGSPAER